MTYVFLQSERAKITTEVLGDLEDLIWYVLFNVYTFCIVDEYNTPENHLFYLTLSNDPLTQEEKEEVSPEEYSHCNNVQQTIL